MGGGSGSSGDTYDADYNARMATIYEEQQDWAREYYNDIYQQYGKNLEIAQLAKNLENVEQEDTLYKQLLGATQSQVGTSLDTFNQATNLATNTMSSLNGLNGQSAQAVADYLATGDKDAAEEAAIAKSDVASAYADTQNQMNRSAARQGINLNSGQYAGTMVNTALQKAADTAAAATKARRDTDTENYTRAQNKATLGSSLLGNNAQTGLSGVNTGLSGISNTLGLMQNATNASSVTNSLLGG